MFQAEVIYVITFEKKEKEKSDGGVTITSLEGEASIC